MMFLPPFLDENTTRNLDGSISIAFDENSVKKILE
jgi:hypothetical protein